MATPIFQSVTVPKSQLYQKMKDLIIAGGWTNVSSNQQYATIAQDADVFYSTGVSGAQSLYFGLRPFGTTYTTPQTYNLSTSAGGHIAWQMGKSYTASGSANTNGTWVQNTVWQEHTLITGTAPNNLHVPITFSITLWYFVNKDKVIFVTCPDYNIGGFFASMLYLGVPSKLFQTEGAHTALTSYDTNCYNGAGFAMNDRPSGAPSTGYQGMTLTSKRISSTSPTYNLAKVAQSYYVHGYTSTDGYRLMFDEFAHTNGPQVNGYETIIDGDTFTDRDTNYVWKAFKISNGYYFSGGSATTIASQAHGTWLLIRVS